MARKLAFLLTDKTSWKLTVRTALAFSAILLPRLAGFSFGIFLVSATILFGLYFFENPERKTLRRTLFVLLILAFVGLGVLNGASPVLFGVFAGLWTIAVFLSFGIVGLFFPDRRLIYGLLNALVLFLNFLVFFYLGGTGASALAGLVLFLAIIFLLQEAFGFYEVASPRRSLVYAGVLGLVILELSWVSGFLPLGFWNAALFLTLIFITLRDAVLYSLRGSLKLALVLKELAITLTLGLIIFAASNWSI